MEVLYIRLRVVISVVSAIAIFVGGSIIVSIDRALYYEEAIDTTFRLVIPDIEVDMVIYDINSYYNDVEYGVEMLENSNISRNVYFFAGHSGSGDNCYFNRVKELDVGDLVYVFVGGKRLVYKIVDKYYIVKNGYMEVDSDILNLLYLITCSSYNRQLIVNGVLIN